jgi:carboxylesterase type B
LKKARGKPLLPVLVYIHGGGFNEGTVNVYGKQDMVNLFAARGIVFIQLEYRMGMFGV